MVARHATLGRNLDLEFAGEIAAGKGLGIARDFGGRAGSDDLASVDTGAGTEVDQVVGGEHRVEVMFDDDDGVAGVAQCLEGLDQLAVVPLVQADAWFVKDVQDADKPAADLAGKTDPLRLATGEGGGGAIQGEVVQADVDQELQSATDLLHEFARDHRLPLRQFDRLEEAQGVPDGKMFQFGKAASGNGDGAGLGLEFLTVAFGAVLLAEVAHVMGAQPFGPCLLQEALDAVGDALPGIFLARHEGTGGCRRPGRGGAPRNLDLVAIGPVHQQGTMRRREVSPRHVRGNAESFEDLDAVAVTPSGATLLILIGPGDDGTFAETEGLVGNHQVLVDNHHVPQAEASGTGPDGTVEREELGAEFIERQVAVGAGIAFGEEEVPGSRLHALQSAARSTIGRGGRALSPPATHCHGCRREGRAGRGSDTLPGLVHG